MVADEQPEEKVSYEMLVEETNRMIGNATTVITEYSTPGKKLTKNEEARLRMARSMVKTGKETLKTLNKLGHGHG